MTPSELRDEIESFLLDITTPGQYIGGEWNSVTETDVTCRLALAFPDAYSVGMSHHGLRILYEVCNALPGVAAERAFTPLPDMEAALRERQLPLYTLESFTPLSDCDLVGFSLQYELAASNLLTMLDLGGIPLLAKDRGDDAPLVLAGGVGAFNPEPYGDFIDLFVIGEGEEVLPRLLTAWQKFQGEANSREDLLRKLVAEVPGLYAPTLYEPLWDDDHSQIGIKSRFADLPIKIDRQIVKDLEAAPQSMAPVVPVVETAHERITLEVLRGCPWGCRFCQAGMVNRPVRARSVESLVEAAKQCRAKTGYDEIGLLSLSTSDYPEFSRLIETLDGEFAQDGISLSLPSLRVNTALKGIPEQVKSVRRGSFTIAPEAATERLRTVINKAVTDEDLLAGAEAAFAAGWRSIKLYFMIGLPTETDEDVLAIPKLAAQVARLRRKKGGGTAVTLSVSNYVPKPQTPFQWEGMNGAEELERKQKLIAEAVNRRAVSYKAHGIHTSLLEGAVARGDRRMGAVLLSAWQKGARLCAWNEYFQPQAWQDAFTANELTVDQFACTPRTMEQGLPWSHVQSGIHEQFFRRELERSEKGERTPPCSADSCAGCGVPNCPWISNR